MQLQPVDETLLLCLRAEFDAAAQVEVHRRLAALAGDASCLWAAATAQQVEPLVARTILSAPPGALPAALVEHARTVRLAALRANLPLDAELAQIRDALAAQAIHHVPLKGTHLARRLYGGLETRRAGDIDLLVPADQWPAARSVLQARTYAAVETPYAGGHAHPFHDRPFVRTVPGARFTVELHWALTDPRAVAVDDQQLWQRIEAASPAALERWELPAEDLLMYLAVHLPKHDTGLLRLLADVDRLVRRASPSLDWSRVLALAVRWQAPGLLHFTLTRAHALLHTPAPAWLLRQLTPAAPRRRLVDLLAAPPRLVRPPVPGRLWAHRFHLAYCAMLTPTSRGLRAYRRYLVDRGANPTRTAVHGLAWTGLVLASATVEYWQHGRAGRHGSASPRRPGRGSDPDAV